MTVFRSSWGISMDAASVSSGCSDAMSPFFLAALAISAVEENMGGEFTHPIRRTSRKATIFSWPGCTGNTTPNCGMSSVATLMR